MILALALSTLSFALAAEVAVAPALGTFARIAQDADGARAGNRFADAIRLYREALTLRPGWTEGRYSLGAILYAEDRFPEALTAFERLAQDPRKPCPAYALLALCEYETHDFSRSLGHFEQWAAQKCPTPPDVSAQARFHWALLLTRERRFGQALALLSAQARAGDRSPALVEALGLASLRLAFVPEQYPSQEREPVWLAGQVALQAGLQQHDRTQDEARELLRRFGAHPDVHYFLGTVWQGQAKLAEAAEEFEAEIRISPKDVAARIQLAFCRLRQAQPESALRAVDDAVVLDTGGFGAHAARGEVLLALGRTGESVVEMETARRLAPGNASVRATLAKVYAALGRDQDASRERAVSVELQSRAAGKANR